jgi:hydrogenase expression/formation protein HypC
MCLGIPGLIVAVSDAARREAVVDVNGVRRAIDVSFIVDDAHPVECCIGAWVLVHVGFAMSRLDADEAARTLALLDEFATASREMEAP